MKKWTNFVVAFTLAEENCQFAHSVRKFGRVEDAQCNCKAFTLAEVLITLAIIGVVSALVIPSVLKNYNDKKYNTARLKALKTFGEAGKLASINGEINGQPSARAFVENVLSKYLKITKVCDNNKASECNFPTTFKTNAGGNKTSNNLKKWKDDIGYNYTQDDWTDVTNTNLSVYLTTNDGFSAKLFYNPKCVRDSHEIAGCAYQECNTYAVDDTCMNVIYDMNGEKAPNRIGEDMGFVTVFWSGIKATAVAPGMIPQDKVEELYGLWVKTIAEAEELCKQYGTPKNPYHVVTLDEYSSLTLNQRISNVPVNTFMTVASVKGSRGNIYWNVNAAGFRSNWRGDGLVYCVRR